MILPPLPPALAEKIELIRGPNIKPLPLKEPVQTALKAVCLSNWPDNITTDDILPSGAKSSPPTV